MKNLTIKEQKDLLKTLFPYATKIVRSEWYKGGWDVIEIEGDDDYAEEIIDSYVYIPGTKKFRHAVTISSEL